MASSYWLTGWKWSANSWKEICRHPLLIWRKLVDDYTDSWFPAGWRWARFSFCVELRNYLVWRYPIFDSGDVASLFPYDVPALCCIVKCYLVKSSSHIACYPSGSGVFVRSWEFRGHCELRCRELTRIDETSWCRIWQRIFFSRSCSVCSASDKLDQRKVSLEWNCRTEFTEERPLKKVWFHQCPVRKCFWSCIAVKTAADLNAPFMTYYAVSFTSYSQKVRFLVSSCNGRAT
jgi:hypothetical protein